MSRHLQLRLPATSVVSLAAAAATWVTLIAWTPFAERPSTFMVPLLGACLLVAVTGAALRTSRVPAVLVVCGQVVVVAVWLHHRWAGVEAWGGWLPTPESLQQVRATWAAAVETAQEYAAPIPRSVTDFAPLMIAAGAATAVLVDFLACGLRRAPLAGLPLLAVYTAPVSILDGGVSWAKFAAAALAFLLLIAAQESSRFTHWGQQVSQPGRAPDPVATGQAVWSSARKIGLSATALAVVVPLLVPTLSVRWFGGGSGPGGDGESVSLTNPIVNMRRDLSRGADVDLVRVRTEDGDPSYLRTTVLDAFDGETWKPSGRSIPVEQRASGLIPRPPGLDAATDRRTVPWTVQVTDEFESLWLPVPYPVFSINAEGDWRYDRSTLDFISAARGQTAAGLSYSLEAVELDHTAARLSDAAPAPSDVFGPYTELPDEIPAVVEEQAREVTRGITDKYRQAQALQQWFREDGGFTYSLERAPGNGVDALERFLSTGAGSRIGYCEQFASSMAVMSRSLGIPSRVAVGFLRPDKVGEGRYVYSAHDLHAWPELYFEGSGWIRFEPTPGVRTGEVPGYSRAGGAPEDTPDRPTESAAVNPNLNRFDEPSASPGATGGGDSDQGGLVSGPALGTLGGLVLAIGLALAPRTVRTLRRRRRWAAATTPAALAEASWAELRETALDLGIAWSDSVTLRTRARELVQSFGRPGADDDAMTRAPERGPEVNPAATEALERIVKRLEIARFARRTDASAAQRSEAEHDVALCVQSLSAGASSRQRTRATWLPASLSRRATLRPTLRAAVDEAGVDHAV